MSQISDATAAKRLKIGQYCQRQRCKHVELEQFWQAFASREFVSDSWAFLSIFKCVAPSGVWNACSDAALICEFFAVYCRLLARNCFAMFPLLFRDTRGVLTACVCCVRRRQLDFELSAMLLYRTAEL